MVGLNINFQEYNDNRVVVVADEKAHHKGPREAELFSDPTTWAASVIKLKDKVHIPDAVEAKARNLNFLAEKHHLPRRESPPPEIKPTKKLILPAQESTEPSGISDKPCVENSSESMFSIDEEPSTSSITSSSSTSTSASTSGVPEKSIPFLKTTELLTPETIVCDTDKQSVWVNGGEREGQSFVVNPGLRRVVQFSGEFEPVARSCNAPLENGELCARRDRFKCPFHGPILDRDTQGNIVGGQTTMQDDKSQDKKKVKKKIKKLKSDASLADTSRGRIEKVVFNKRSLKRVSATLDAADRKRTHSLFSEQFNYS